MVGCTANEQSGLVWGFFFFYLKTLLSIEDSGLATLCGCTICEKPQSFKGGHINRSVNVNIHISPHKWHSAYGDHIHVVLSIFLNEGRYNIHDSKKGHDRVYHATRTGNLVGRLTNCPGAWVVLFVSVPMEL